MSMLRSYYLFVGLAVTGILVFASTFVLLGKTAGAFFGFMYIILVPILYELVQRTSRLFFRGSIT